MQQLQDYVTRYLDYCKYQKKLSQKSLKAYTIDLNQFLQFEQNACEKLNKEHLNLYITHLHKTYKPKSIKRKIACLKAFCSYLEFDDIIETNPFRKIRIKFQEPVLLPKTISLASVQSIFQAAYGELLNDGNTSFQSSAVSRDIAVLELLFATGVRVSELCSLKQENVDITEGAIRIYGKGSKERVVQISNADVISALVRYSDKFAEHIKKSGYFFVNRLGRRLSEQSVRFMIRKYTQKSGLAAHVTPHMFRHSFATLLLEEDVDVRYIQKLLGHSSIVTTQIYTHVALSKQRSILSEKHPRNKMKI